MKKSALIVTLALALLLFTNPAWSYEADVGWVGFTHYTGAFPGTDTGTYDSTGVLWSGDNFNSGIPQNPPYTYVGNPSMMSVSGGILKLSPLDNSYHVQAAPPNYNSSVVLQNMQMVKFLANYQGAPPPLGYAFVISIDSHPYTGNYVALSIGTSSAGTGIMWEDSTHTGQSGNPLSMTLLSGYTSIGLMIITDASGNATAKYTLNPLDGALTSAMTWVDVPGTATFDSSTTNWEPEFGTSSTESVPEPSTMAVLGLVGAYCSFWRRKKTGEIIKSILHHRTS